MPTLDPDGSVIHLTEEDVWNVPVVDPRHPRARGWYLGVGAAMVALTVLACRWQAAAGVLMYAAFALSAAGLTAAILLGIVMGIRDHGVCRWHWYIVGDLLLSRVFVARGKTEQSEWSVTLFVAAIVVLLWGSLLALTYFLQDVDRLERQAQQIPQAGARNPGP